MRRGYRVEEKTFGHAYTFDTVYRCNILCPLYSFIRTCTSFKPGSTRRTHIQDTALNIRRAISSASDFVVNPVFYAET